MPLKRLAYDYANQCWVRFHGTRFDGAWIWIVGPCEHADPDSCYACQNAGDIILHHEYIH